jgi:hypothetical protein
VGLVAVNILGNGMEEIEGEENVKNAIVRGIIERSYVDDHTMPDEDLAHFDHDRFIVKAIAHISRSKKTAVETDDFQQAKQLKHLEEIFSKAAVEVFTLQSKKRQVTLSEDYDQAQFFHVLKINLV